VDEVFQALAVPIAGGLMLAAAAAGLGPISGAHLNPAVTDRNAYVGTPVGPVRRINA
jgi:glycerol uptake facilitator-like aquaporin